MTQQPPRPVDRELSIAELLDDPLVRLLMRRDRVKPAELRAIIARMKARLDHDPRRRSVA